LGTSSSSASWSGPPLRPQGVLPQV
jgi:hypothetical protein